MQPAISSASSNVSASMSNNCGLPRPPRNPSSPWSGLSKKGSHTDRHRIGSTIFCTIRTPSSSGPCAQVDWGGGGEGKGGKDLRAFAHVVLAGSACGRTAPQKYTKADRRRLSLNGGTSWVKSHKFISVIVVKVMVVMMMMCNDPDAVGLKGKKKKKSAN